MVERLPPQTAVCFPFLVADCKRAFCVAIQRQQGLCYSVMLIILKLPRCSKQTEKINIILMMPVVWNYGILVILISRYCSDDVYLLIFAAYCMTAEWCRSLNSFHCRNWVWKCFFFSSQTLALRIVSACCGAFVSSIRTEQCCCCWGVFSKWECVAAGHDNNMVATKLECKCHSGLSYDVTTSSSAVCLQIQKCYNTAVCKGADWTWQRRFSTWRGGGGTAAYPNAPVRIGADLTGQFFTSHHLPGTRKLGL